MVGRLGSHQSIGWRAIASAHCCHCQRVFASWSQRWSWSADTSLSGRWRLLIPGRNVSSTGQHSGFLMIIYFFGCCFSLKFHQAIVFPRKWHSLFRQDRNWTGWLIFSKDTRFFIHPPQRRNLCCVPNFCLFLFIITRCYCACYWTKQCAEKNKKCQYLEECQSSSIGHTINNDPKMINRTMYMKPNENKTNKSTNKFTLQSADANELC